jgi:DNA repair protein RadC
MAHVQDILGHYTFKGPQSDEEVLAAAEEILMRKLERQGEIGNPQQMETWLRHRMAHLEHEEFHLVLLDNRHRILAAERMFRGTVDGASVHPREVVKTALHHNASAVVLAHNHPSQVPEPSAADRAITNELRKALELVGVRVLDHIVVAADRCVSFAARGLL